jgi:hypothetical protein
MSDATRWEVRGSDAYLITYVDGEPYRCREDIDWTVVLATDFDALEAERNALAGVVADLAALLGEWAQWVDNHDPDFPGPPESLQERTRQVTSSEAAVAP